MSEALPQARVFPIAQLDLVEEVRQIRASPMSHGHLAKTLVHSGGLRVVLMVLQRGHEIPRHSAKGALAIQILDGRVVVGALESSFDLAAGRLLALQPAIEHSVVAVEDSAILLTVAKTA